MTAMMNWAGLSFALAIVSVAGQDYNISYLRSIAAFSNYQHCMDTKAPGPHKICFNETTSQICYNNADVMTEFCKGSNPRCVGGECSSKGKADFNCPKEYGHFPSLTSCYEYYICNEYNAYLVQCLNKNVYDPVTKTCVKQSSLKPCYRFSCSGRDMKFVPYPGDAKYFALCARSQPVALDECNGDNMGMYENIQRCDLYCTKEGNIPDPANCTAYYECVVDSGTRYRLNQRDCPTGMHFDIGSSLCAPGPC